MGTSTGRSYGGIFDEIYFEYRTHEIIIISYALYLRSAKAFMENLCNFQAEILLTSLPIVNGVLSVLIFNEENKKVFIFTCTFNNRKET